MKTLLKKIRGWYELRKTKQWLRKRKDEEIERQIRWAGSGPEEGEM